jgi:large subunit ribosomal protein L1
MPNPKAGCVVPANANLQPLVEKLKSTVRVSVKTAPLFQCRVGNEETPEENLIDNIHVIYNSMLHALPNELDNIKSVYLKLTMGPAVKIGEKEEDSEKKSKNKLHVKPTESKTEIKQ